MVNPRSWESEYSGPLDEETVRSKFVPRHHYRVTRYCFPKGATFEGSMQSGRCFVLRGRCRYSFADATTVMSRGEFADLPAGSYVLEVVGEDELELVVSWQLPEAFWSEGNSAD